MPTETCPATNERTGRRCVWRAGHGGRGHFDAAEHHFTTAEDREAIAARPNPPSVRGRRWVDDPYRETTQQPGHDALGRWEDA